jgi:hypothetical protein
MLIAIFNIRSLFVSIVVAAIYSSFAYAGRIETLKKNLTGDESRKHVVASFWDEVEKDGGPIIEESEKPNDQVTVTFLWRESSSIKHVSLYCEDVKPWGLGEPMEHIENTDIWFKKVSVPKNATIMYGFVRGLRLPDEGDHISSSKEKELEIEHFFEQIQKDPLNPKAGVVDSKGRLDFFESNFKPYISAFVVPQRKLSVLDLSKNLNRT